AAPVRDAHRVRPARERLGVGRRAVPRHRHAGDCVARSAAADRVPSRSARRGDANGARSSGRGAAESADGSLSAAILRVFVAILRALVAILASRPAGNSDGTGRLHLFPDPTTDLVRFGYEALLVHREDLPIPHHELTVDHYRLDVGRLTVVDPGRDEAPG